MMFNKGELNQVFDLYVSKIKIVSDPSNELAKTLAKRLEELGYYVVNENPEIYVFFYPWELL